MIFIGNSASLTSSTEVLKLFIPSLFLLTSSLSSKLRNTKFILIHITTFHHWTLWKQFVLFKINNKWKIQQPATLQNISSVLCKTVQFSAKLILNSQNFLLHLWRQKQFTKRNLNHSIQLVSPLPLWSKN